MDEFIQADRVGKAITKFYGRIRSQLDDLVLLPPDSECPISEKLKGADLSEEDKYGFIRKGELEAILKVHDAQPNKSAHCNQLDGGSIAKLLFSKRAFHNNASTDYLIEDLKINDTTRNSFLGGHSTYITSEENSLEHLHKCQRKMLIIERVKHVICAMDSSLKTQTVLSEEIERDIKELYELGQEDSDVLIVKGKHRIVQKRYDDAIDYLRSAIQNDCTHIELAKQNLSDAFLNKGLIQYQKKEYGESSDCFNESLRNNPNNESAKLHLDITQMKLIQERRSFGSNANMSYQRRR